MATNEIIEGFQRIAKEAKATAEKVNASSKRYFCISRWLNILVILTTFLVGAISIHSIQISDVSHAYITTFLGFISSALVTGLTMFSVERKGTLMIATATRMRHIVREISSHLTAYRTETGRNDNFYVRLINLYGQELEATQGIIYHTDIVNNGNVSNDEIVLPFDAKTETKVDVKVVDAKAETKEDNDDKQRRKQELMKELSTIDPSIKV